MNIYLLLGDVLKLLAAYSSILLLSTKPTGIYCQLRSCFVRYLANAL